MKVQIGGVKYFPACRPRLKSTKFGQGCSIGLKKTQKAGCSNGSGDLGRDDDSAVGTPRDGRLAARHSGITIARHVFTLMLDVDHRRRAYLARLIWLHDAYRG